MSRSDSILVLLLTAGIAALGCGRAEEPAVEATQVTAPETSTTEEPPRNVESPSTADDLPNSPEPAETEPGQGAATYTLPFPGRLELFEPPQRAQSMTRRDDESGETVELKGFIFVEEPRVVLEIDGVVSSIPAGGEKYGVQVISIDPPNVVLQRGRNRWPATLE